MNAKVKDLMVSQVMTTTPHRTVGRVREVMHEHGIHSMPVIDPEGEPVGIVTSSDLLGGKSDESRVSSVMTRNVYTVPKYADVSTAARVMRNHHIHHVVVTHEKKIAGMLSSFDLLRLVEDHRFVAKNAPTPSRKARKKMTR